MSKSKLVRSGLLGSAAALALLGAATTAQAVETEFGEVSIVFDTTLSVGASMRTTDRNTQFLPENNGGPVDPRDGPGGIVLPVAPGGSEIGVPDFHPVFPFTGRFRYTANQDNFDGSTNSDDARLNFNNGDLLGANVKANHDLVMKWRNYTVFARAIGFYDAVMNSEDVGERSLLTDDALGDVGRNYELLDLFLSADYRIGNMPLNLRVGKQVINWGESTFILGGNNAFNPIDVAAFRRPGAEIKEALLPVNAVSGSISFPFDVSLSGYYALDWEPFELDPSGTPFSSADVVAFGTGRGGNQDLLAHLSGSPFSGQRRTCAADAIAFSNFALTPIAPGAPTIYDLDGAGPGTVGLLKNPNSPQAFSLDCLDIAAITGGPNFIQSTVPYTFGLQEFTRQSLFRNPALAAEGFTRIGQALIRRDSDRFAPDDGQYGLSARWYVQSLGGTEFGFYYQNYHSRLPIISENVRLAELHIQPVTGSFQVTTGHATRFALPTGCLLDGNPATFIDPGSPVNRFTPAVLGSVPIGDPEDILNLSSAGAAFAVSGGSVVLYNNPNPAIGLNNMLAAAQLNCVLAFVQAGSNAITGRPTLFDGAEVLTASTDQGLYVEYPEDIEVWGISFNTTAWGVGVQGDFTYRQDAPFQIDTDSIAIAAAGAACAFPVGAADLATTFEARHTYPGVGCFANGTAGNRDISGVQRNQMYTAQIGTTSLFTASDWWVDALGGDVATVVTETGMVFVPDVETTWLDRYDPDGVNPSPADLPPTRFPTQYANTGCQGSDLPLGGLLGLDRKRSVECRPNDFSAGLVILARMEYNNAFDSGWVLVPQVVYSYDFMGTTPAPYSNYLEDRQTIGLSLTGTLNNNLRVGASYSNFFGGHIHNKAKDTDFASLTASYTY